ncbi:NAD(+) synthase [Halorubrum sp. DTA46]|uniref:NAD(+) synthase n=1 Tax=Halorubrum sp. DTA46 TaxID=3402162 RepID=UPI003AAAAEFF
MDETGTSAFDERSTTVGTERDPDGDSNTRDDPSVDGDSSLFVPREVGAERDRIGEFVQRHVTDAGAEGVVVNMSGGLDSTVTAALAVEALGTDRVYGLVLPCNKIGAPHARDAEALADALGIEHDTVHLQPLFAQFGATAPDRFDLHDEPVRSGNAVARLRMATAYLAANATNRLVCGTTNRSELLLGYVTKHGDGAADLLPLGHLYKTDVRALAEALDVPEFVVEKPPTAGFLPGQRDVDDLGASYEVIDSVLQLGVDRGLDPDTIRERFDDAREGFDEVRDGEVDTETIADLLARHRETEHKRVPAPIPGNLGR